MTHSRQTIRERIATRLTGLTTTGSNVFQSRVYPLQASELPALRIYTGDEEAVEDLEVMGYEGVIQVEARIEVAVRENDTYDDTLDLILEEVQAALVTERASATAGHLPDDFLFARHNSKVRTTR